MNSTTLRLNNKVHAATTVGTMGECRDNAGRWAVPVCGTKNRTRPSYTDPTTTVTCLKCQG